MQKAMQAGGPGSGNFDHAGRPGEVGGSGEGGGSSSKTSSITLEKAVKLNAENFIDSRKVNRVSKAILESGDVSEASLAVGASDEHVAAANLLISKIREAPEENVPLYRGLSKNEHSPELEGLMPGQVIMMPRLTSFTEDRNVAEQYTVIYGAQYHYEFQLEGPSKTVKTDHLTGMSHKEHVTQGKFEVVANKPGPVRPFYKWNYERIITLRQVGVL